MPLMECRRRRRKECPWPARNGATPGAMVWDSGAGLTRDAICALLSFAVRRSHSNLALSELGSRGVKETSGAQVIDGFERGEDSTAFQSLLVRGKRLDIMTATTPLKQETL
jgi:hypothetical protein